MRVSVLSHALISRIDRWKLDVVQILSPKPQEPLKIFEAKRTWEGQIWAWCAMSNHLVSSLFPLVPAAGLLDPFFLELVPS